jgi:hypothetical protein
MVFDMTLNIDLTHKRPGMTEWNMDEFPGDVIDDS